MPEPRVAGRMILWGWIAMVVSLGCAPAWAAHHPPSDIDEVRVTSAYTPDQGEFEFLPLYEWRLRYADRSSRSKKI